MVVKVYFIENKCLRLKGCFANIETLINEK